mgnify:FL=1
MFSQFLAIFFKLLKLDKTLYEDGVLEKIGSKIDDKKKPYNLNLVGLELSFYYSLIIVVMTVIIQTIPNNVYLSWMSERGLQIEQPTFRYLLFISLLVWFLKSFFIYVVGVKIFPNKNTKCNFLKVLITVGLAHSPLIFNFLIFNDSLFYGVLLIYVWYVSALVVGINEILNYKNKLKSFLISFIAPIVISLSLMILYLKISI